MDFELSEDEVALADGIRSLCAGRFPLARLRAAEGGDGLVDREAWAELAEAGVFSLQLPEAAGGVGLGMAAAAVVFEELGRALVPGPDPGQPIWRAGDPSRCGRWERSWSVPSGRRPASGPESFVPTLVGHLSLARCPRRGGRRRD